VAELEFRPEDVFWERKPGQWELNPLLLARIAERIQFDGDVPELRSGNLPEGGKPAVSVVADTTDPVLLGLMLSCASLDAQEELNEARRAWEATQEALVETTGQLARMETMPVFSARGYEPGHVPVPRRIDVLPLDAARLSKTERQTAAFSAIATTQGRNSALLPIIRLIREGLAAAGVELHEGAVTSPPLAQAMWTMEITQAQAINPRFSHIGVAGQALLRDLLLRSLSTKEKLVLVVKPIHAIHERKVGWRASLHG